MSDVKCPYCEGDIEIDHDDGYGYEEGEIYNQECGKCGKIFVYRTSILFYYDLEKADCLNDEEHKYEKTKTYPPQFARLRCKICGDEKPIEKTLEDLAKVMSQRRYSTQADFRGTKDMLSSGTHKEN
jgi:hypothetical protein